VVLAMTGCTGKTGSSVTTSTSSSPKEEEKTPNGGKLFMTKDEIHHHLELVSEKDKPAVAYLHDKSLKKPIATSAMTITMSTKGSKDKIEFKADRQEKDPAGKSSRFKSDKPLGEIKDWKAVEFSVKIDDKDFIFVEDED